MSFAQKSKKALGERNDWSVHPFSIAVPSFNDGTQLRRFLFSTLATPGLDEIVVVDHRSTDDTPLVLREMKSVLSENGIRLESHREQRDFSSRFSMADLRSLSVELCTNDVVCTMDADYVIGPGLKSLMERAFQELARSDVYAVGHAIPYLQPPVRFSKEGVLEHHGPCYRHEAIPRLLLSSHQVCRQDHVNGRFYRFYSSSPERSVWVETPWMPESVISINDKKVDRWKVRLTMNNYFEAIARDPSLGRQPWLQSIAAGKIDSRVDQTDYFHHSNLWDVDLRGQRFHVR